MLPDAWQEHLNPGSDPLSSSRRFVRRAPITEITLWLKGFGRLASVLTSSYPSKAAEMRAYQSSIIRAARTFDGSLRLAIPARGPCSKGPELVGDQRSSI